MAKEIQNETVVRLGWQDIAGTGDTRDSSTIVYGKFVRHGN